MNSFVPITNKLALRINTGLLLAVTVGIYFDVNQMLLMTTIVVTLLISVFAKDQTINMGADPELAKISILADEISHGNLEHRIMGVPWEHPVNAIAHELNDALDQVEAYIREVDAVFRLARKGQFH